MSVVAIDELYKIIIKSLGEEVLPRIEIKRQDEEGLVVIIIGDTCSTSIRVYKNGCCDVDFYFVEADRFDFKYFELENTESAAERVLREIDEALTRA